MRLIALMFAFHWVAGLCLGQNVFSGALNYNTTSGLLYTLPYGFTPESFPLMTPLPSIIKTKGDVAYKAMTLPANAWTTIAAYSGGQGMIQRIWFAMAGSIPTTYINIRFDDAATPQVGSNAATPSIDNAIEIDVMFLSAYGSTESFAGDDFGCNNLASNTMGAYFTMDMPFNRSFEIQLYSTASVGYWIQVFYVSYPNNDAVIPMHFYLKPSNGLGWGTESTYPAEVPLLSIAGPNGVFLKYFKWLFSGMSGYWVEGRFRVYEGGQGLTSSISSVHYEDSSNTVISPYTASATVLLVSTGTEDFFQSTWSFENTPYYANHHAGYLWSSVGEGVTLTPTSSFSAYRVFGAEKKSLPVFSAPGETLVFTYAVGDALVGASGSGTWAGLVGYYA